MTRRIELTVSDETWDHIEAARGLVPRAAWIKAAVDRALIVYDGQLEVRAEVEALKNDPEKAARVLNAEKHREPVADVLGAKVFKGASVPSSFKCPIARCEFTAKSPAAKCGAHGRTVVPV